MVTSNDDDDTLVLHSSRTFIFPSFQAERRAKWLATKYTKLSFPSVL
jgi:hypothetical protein